MKQNEISELARKAGLFGTFVKYKDEIETFAKLVAAKAIAELESQEPVAWRTFDGEGQYEYRAYEENESYADDWDKRNPNHKGWVEPLYTHPPQPEQQPRNVRERWNVELDGNDLLVCFNDHEKGDKCQYERYSPQRTWVGLEGEEIRNLWEEATKPDRSTMTMVTSFARAIEAKLKERNT